MHEAGALSDEEFAAAKRRVLASAEDGSTSRGPAHPVRPRTDAGRATPADGSAHSDPQRSPAQPSSHQVEAVESRGNNKFAVAGFALGLASIFLYEIGIVPVLAVAISIVGLATYDPAEQTGRWMALVGLVLGVVYTFAYLVAYGHISI